jgi:long-chain acyl-CoA synthetase
MFFQRVAELGERPFVRWREGDDLKELTWRDFGARVRRLMIALRRRGLVPGDTVAMIGNNSVEWLCADLATLAAGFPNVIVQPGLSDRMLVKLLAHAGCRAAFVKDITAVGRLLNLRGQLPALRDICVMEEEGSSLPDTVSFQQLIGCANSPDDRQVWEMLEAVHPNDLATIMYTSGSSGEPKGVMRTQNNLLANITNGGAIRVSGPEDVLVIVLSLNHLFGRFGFLKSAVIGRTVALVEATELAVDLNAVQALAGTAIGIVPRVLERLFNAMLDRDSNRRDWQELEALDERRSCGALDEAGQKRFNELRDRVSQSVRAALGGRIRYISYSAAAMPPRVMRFFEQVGIPLIGSYGLTECGGVTVCGVGEHRPGNLGKPFANVELRIGEDGEILVRGPTVTPGYFKDPEATRQALDANGWFHTGDLGVVEADGSLRIVGRKKDVFNCADGSNIYPGFIELQLESETFIKQAILLGDRRPFVAALVVPDRDRIAAALGRAPGTLSAEEISAVLWTAIGRVNGRLEDHEKIRKIAVIEEDFPHEARSVSSFQKVKVDRAVVAALYQNEIAMIYSADSEGERS